MNKKLRKWLHVKCSSIEMAVNEFEDFYQPPMTLESFMALSDVCKQYILDDYARLSKNHVGLVSVVRELIDDLKDLIKFSSILY